MFIKLVIQNSVNTVKLFLGECSPVESQHWFGRWVDAAKQQAITWVNVDHDLCHHMASLGHNGLKACVRAKVLATCICIPIYQIIYSLIIMLTASD